MTPKQQDIVFALESVPGVAAVRAMGDDVIVELRPYSARVIAEAHYILLPLIGREAAGRVRYAHAEQMWRSARDGTEVLTLTDLDRAAARARAEVHVPLEEVTLAGAAWPPPPEDRPDDEPGLDMLPPIPAGTPRVLVHLFDIEAVRTVEASARVPVIVAQDPRMPAARRIRMTCAALASPFALIVTDSTHWPFYSSPESPFCGIPCDGPVVVFRPTSKLPREPRVLHEYAELRDLLASIA